MRKSTKGQPEDGETLSPVSERTTTRRAVIKTDRTPEEWSPSIQPKAEESSIESQKDASSEVPQVSETTITAQGDSEIVSDGEPDFASMADLVPANVPDVSVNPMQHDSAAVKKNHFERRERRIMRRNDLSTQTTGNDKPADGLSPHEERAAKWGRFSRRRAMQAAAAAAQGDGQDTAAAEQVVPEEPMPQLPTIYLKDLEELGVEELTKKVEEFLGAEELAGKWRKNELLNSFIRAYIKRKGTVYTSGIIEVVNDGSGFLRSEKSSYQSSPDDIFVAQQFVRRFNLRTGDFIEGPIRDPLLKQEKGKEKYLAVGRIDKVNGCTPAEWRRVIPFENLTPIFPNRRIELETKSDILSTRIMNLFAPIGFGQRGIIVAPPRTGKTVLMQKIANAITQNHPDAYLIVLLIDERPEEVTDMQRNTKAHVVSSTFDEAPERHAQVAEMVIEMSKRMVESGKDVIILLDSITRLARAYNTLQPNSGRILSGGVDAMGLHKPKRFFGAARNIENGGSLTIIATALIDTGSRMDEVIFEEFKGTGNMELVLDRMLADRRIYPAIDVEASGTRKEDLLMHPDELARIWSIRKALNGMQPTDMMDTVIKAMKKTQNNAEFLLSVAVKN